MDFLVFLQKKLGMGRAGFQLKDDMETIRHHAEAKPADGKPYPYAGQHVEEGRESAPIIPTEIWGQVELALFSEIGVGGWWAKQGLNL